VIDFGLARQLGQNHVLDLKGGSIMGTIEFLAPEVARSSHASAASDAWSGGVVLYMLFTGGASPFWAGDAAGTRRRIVKGDLDFGGASFQRVSEEGMDVLRGLLHVDDRRRMSMAQALDHAWAECKIRRDSCVETGLMRRDFVRRRWRKSAKGVMIKG